MSQLETHITTLGSELQDLRNLLDRAPELQRQARELFAHRVQHFAGQLGVQVKRIALSSARTRWGSASADGSIRLHWRLMHFSHSVIDYVVAHELAHLREMNHSPRFWEVVRSVMPEFDAARDQLRRVVIPD